MKNRRTETQQSCLTRYKKMDLATQYKTDKDDEHINNNDNPLHLLPSKDDGNPSENGEGKFELLGTKVIEKNTPKQDLNKNQGTKNKTTR